MPTQCNAEQLQFSCIERRRVVAGFDDGTVSSDAGALLLGRADEAIGLIDRLAGCFVDARKPELIEHSLRTLIGQRARLGRRGALSRSHEPDTQSPAIGESTPTAAARSRR
jgi:hypothetical protein